MEEEPASPHPGPSASLADSLLAQARRRGVAVPEDGSVAGLLAALDPNPLIPHPLLLVAGAVMAVAFRHDRALALLPADASGTTLPSAPSADYSF
ncbi:hypothetical protein TSH100_29215 [Azospirillum sp. TSH100]|uniref:hypothetical protein n=1 Tax=Azospirillum sp. TSH100 TaxID=652764 RepID=UPI000D612F99|nr:hypothetical protein [Azospirillum sp. TSH100]PWC80569.1 hypothetical protein TSH100_29215 [Azospirillum sp. TSH100]QCG91816.1 hypothetical protein E6C72_28910 [Azospirillum sp. TSH100]